MIDLSKFKEVRKRKRMSQIDVAVELKVSMLTVQMWERQAAVPSPENEPNVKKFLEE